MKTLIKYLGLISLATLLVFGSCSKDNDEDNPPAKTKTELLTAGFWKVTAITIDPGIIFGTTVITDFYAQLLDCEKDDLMKFETNGKITDDGGATKCDPNDPQTTSEGTWVFSANGESVTVSYPGDDPVSFEIITLNETTLSGVFTVIEDFGSGPLTYAFTQTFKLQ